jgi:hypothetical protein
LASVGRRILFSKTMGPAEVGPFSGPDLALNVEVSKSDGERITASSGGAANSTGLVPAPSSRAMGPAIMSPMVLPCDARFELQAGAEVAREICPRALA